jgi:CRP-like cAMP-binding protein
MLEDDVLERVSHRLAGHVSLETRDRQALRNLPRELEEYGAGACVTSAGATCDRTAILLEGLAFGQIGSPHKLRQIASFVLPGDLVDLHGALTGVSAQTIMAVTDCKFATFAVGALGRLVDDCPRIARALLMETLREAAVAREWVMNVGRRTARQRVAHLCCELAWRSREAGLGDGESFQMPLSTDQFADATGLTRLHVSQIFQRFEDDGLVVRDGPTMSILHAAKLGAEADFDDLYLRVGANR